MKRAADDEQEPWAAAARRLMPERKRARVPAEANAPALNLALRPPPTLPLSPEQQAVVDTALAEPYAHLFLTGDAGTGKSHTLLHLIHALATAGVAVAVTASTGVAAIDIGGRTLHWFAGLLVDQPDESPASIAARLGEKAKARARWRQTHTLVIDEISMIDAYDLDRVDGVARHMRGALDVPFGGLRLIACGDFFQLPPVAKLGRPPMRFAFESRAWTQARPRLFDLRHSHRHEDDAVFATQLLPLVRRGECSPAVRAAIQACVGRALAPDAIVTHIMPHNAEVDRINARKMAELPAPEHVFVAVDDVAPHARAQVLKEVRAPATVALKAGAQVMLLRNLDMDLELVNGAVGLVRGFALAMEFAAPGEPAFRELHSRRERQRVVRAASTPLEAPDAPAGFPIVEFIGHGRQPGDTHNVWAEVRPVLWEVFEPGRRASVASRQQVPLVPAYAMSVHKSQGQTITCSVVADLGPRIFADGQAYVLLSRIRTLGQLSLQAFAPASIRADARVKAFYANPDAPPPDPPAIAFAFAGAGAGADAGADAGTPVPNTKASWTALIQARPPPLPPEPAYTCSKCARRLALESVVRGELRRLKQPPMLAALIRPEVKEALAAGTWTCLRCLDPLGQLVYAEAGVDDA
jgi:ATP-dependent DNA helicase PIF1